LTDNPEVPVSWFVIERGWKVVVADGTEIGTVDETVGDSSHDIFDGLTVKTGLLDKPRYVPAELVGTITEGRVELKLTTEEARTLRAYDQPAAVETIVPAGGSWWARFLDSFRRPKT
jgi:hypothetical protein